MWHILKISPSLPNPEYILFYNIVVINFMKMFSVVLLCAEQHLNQVSEAGNYGESFEYRKLLKIEQRLVCLEAVSSVENVLYVFPFQQTEFVTSILHSLCLRLRTQIYYKLIDVVKLLFCKIF